METSIASHHARHGLCNVVSFEKQAKLKRVQAHTKKFSACHPA
jgi:hypothetical protein